MIARLRTLAARWLGRGGAQAPGAGLPVDAEYARWIGLHDTLSAGDIAAIRAAFDDEAPLVTVVVDPRGAPREAVDRTRRSVAAQLYPSVEFLAAPLDAVVAGQAKGAFIAVVMAGDTLAPHALSVLVQEMLAHPDAAFAYSDEDEEGEDGARRSPYFKSAWNADLALAQDYACRLALVRTPAFRQAGGFTGDPAPAALYDLVLRLSETGASILHAPFVLYHRRSSGQAPANVERLMTAAVDRHLSRTNGRGSASELGGGSRRVAWPLPEPAPLISLIVPTRDRVDLLRTCVEGLRLETDYPALEILILDNESAEPETHEYFRSLGDDPRVRIIQAPGDFNFPRINNLGAAQARGEIVGLINNDLKVMEPGWLREMAAQAVRPEVGAVGSLLFYGDGSVQHAGCVLGIGGVASHVYKRRPAGEPGHGGRMRVAQEMSAVTAACLLSRKAVWDSLGGFDEELAVAYNDVDYCLRVRAAGLRVIWTPHARLYHLESATRGDDKSGERRERLELEKAKMARRWGEVLSEDPFFSPNLSLKSTDCRPAFPPRVRRFWDVPGADKL